MNLESTQHVWYFSMLIGPGKVVKCFGPWERVHFMHLRLERWAP